MYQVQKNKIKKSTNYLLHGWVLEIVLETRQGSKLYLKKVTYFVIQYIYEEQIGTFHSEKNTILNQSPETKVSIITVRRICPCGKRIYSILFFWICKILFLKWIPSHTLKVSLAYFVGIHLYIFLNWNLQIFVFSLSQRNPVCILNRYPNITEVPQIKDSQTPAYQPLKNSDSHSSTNL